LAGVIGGGAYWAGQAAARPLFSPCGQSLFFARALYVVENLYFVVIQQLAIIGGLGSAVSSPVGSGVTKRSTTKRMPKNPIIQQ